jgi:hypothetical protein
MFNDFKEEVESNKNVIIPCYQSQKILQLVQITWKLIFIFEILTNQSFIKDRLIRRNIIFKISQIV